MHNTPHTPEAKAKMRAACQDRQRTWDWLPEAEIVARLMATTATTRSIASEYGCSDSTIKKILRNHTTAEQRKAIKNSKQAARLRGRKLVETRRTRDTQHMAARAAVNNAVRRGRLTRPTHCQTPGCEKQGRIEGHHWKGYEPQHWLDVVWLCSSCHRKADAGSQVWVLTFEVVRS